MARLVALLVLIVAVYTVYGFALKPQCGPNEEWSICAKPEICEEKCGQETPLLCPLVCVERCQCLQGYKRNLINLCVLSPEC
nr:PREDICTED: chymotrypsin/elastase isoinhibitor 1-like [Linepithema humile]